MLEDGSWSEGAAAVRLPMPTPPAWFEGAEAVQKWRDSKKAETLVPLGSTLREYTIPSRFLLGFP